MAHDLREDEVEIQHDILALAKAFDRIRSGLPNDLELPDVSAAGWQIQRLGSALLFIRGDMIFTAVMSSLADNLYST